MPRPLLPRRALGLVDSDKIQNDLVTQCASMLNVTVRPQVWVEQVNNVVVMGVFIAEAPAADKPVYLKSPGLPKGAFRRVGSTDQVCIDADLAALFSARSEAPYDASILPETGLSDIDPEAVLGRAKPEVALVAGTAQSRVVADLSPRFADNS